MRRASLQTVAGKASARLHGARGAGPAPRSLGPLGAWLALACALGLGLLSPQAAQAQSAAQIKAGQDKARSCAVCHGQLGISSVPNAPNLAGQPAMYLVEQLKAYRSGKRPNEIMSVIARPLTDDDIADLSAWYSAIRLEATAPN